MTLIPLKEYAQLYIVGLIIVVAVVGTTSGFVVIGKPLGSAERYILFSAIAAVAMVAVAVAMFVAFSRSIHGRMHRIFI